MFSLNFLNFCCLLGTETQFERLVRFTLSKHCKIVRFTLSKQPNRWVSKGSYPPYTYTASGAILSARVLERQKPAPPVANQKDEFWGSIQYWLPGDGQHRTHTLVIRLLQFHLIFCISATNIYWDLRSSERMAAKFRKRDAFIQMVIFEQVF